MEEFPGKNINIRRNRLEDDERIFSIARDRPGLLTEKQCRRLKEIGENALTVEHNTYVALVAFRETNDFAGLRRIADFLLKERPDSTMDLPQALILLEDHEKIAELLNDPDNKLSKFVIGDFFDLLNPQLQEYITEYLKSNKTPVATGAINEGVDLIAIRNLAKKYDIAVPMARGGLYQGAMADFWGMPNRTIDVAAHNRKVPRAKWVHPVTEKDFAGKKVLLFDKDAVSGASVRKTVSMLEKFKPSEIGIYFTHKAAPPTQVISTGMLSMTHGLPPKVKVYSPANPPLENAGDIYMEAHERLETQYGRLRKNQRLIMEEAGKIETRFPKLAESLREAATKAHTAFDSLNPNMKGVKELRENILSRLDVVYRSHIENARTNLYEIPGVVDNTSRVISHSKFLGDEYLDIVVREYFRDSAFAAAQKRGVDNPHNPSSPLAAFNAAYEASKGFDVVLIVGPEGFAYEPYFKSLGMLTVAINIPESGADETRTIQFFDDLSKLQGQKVLVVEDDVRTGATLYKLLEHMKSHPPSELGLYLGQPKEFQRLEKIPKDFAKVYVADSQSQVEEKFTGYLRSHNQTIFKYPEH